MTQPVNIQRDDARWKMLYRAGSVAALIAVFIFRRNLGAELTLFGGQTIPRAAGDWFALLDANPLLGLAYLNLFDVVNYALVGLMFLALYAALRRAHPSAMRIAVSLSLVGVGVYFASNQAFAMLSLSQQYAVAATDAERAAFIAAGEALLASNNPGAVYQGTGIYLSLLSVTLAGLIASWVMRRSSVFSKATAYFGILAHVLLLGYFPALLFAPSLIAVPLVIWQGLLGIRLWQLARDAQRETNVTHAHPINQTRLYG